jgi:hypothetical protein
VPGKKIIYCVNYLIGLGEGGNKNFYKKIHLQLIFLTQFVDS